MVYILRNRNQKFEVIQHGLLINLDAGVSASYPGSGTLWTDLTGNGNNAVLTGGAGYTTENGGGINLSAGGHYAQGQTVVEPTPLVTTNVWLKAISEGSNNDFGGQTVFASSPELQHGWLLAHVWLNSGAASSFIVNQGIFAPNNSAPRNTVLNLCGVKSSTQNLLYINGTLVASLNQTAPPVYATGGNRQFRVGKWGYSGYEREFRGHIYAANLYNRGLSAAEVLENFNRMRGRFSV